jgi:NADP-dependent aldehyde dehydrogenase
MKIASERPEPIPVYAEMSSINPVILFPQALARRGADIGRAFAASLTLGAGQFCTNPGLVLAAEGPGLDAFLEAAGDTLGTTAAATMLTPGIFNAFTRGIETLAAHRNVTLIASGQEGATLKAQARLFSTSAEAFLTHPDLHAEIFGATSLVVRCPTLAVARQILETLEGQLTAALHIDDADIKDAQPFIPLLEGKVGRILVNGFGTGVEVSHAMVHGGPYPSTSDGRSTSVGSLAINRFLRPVCYQDLPDALLPDVLKGQGAADLPKRVDGKLQS